MYTAAEVRALSPVRESIEKQGPQPEKYDIFLCHAWEDRRSIAKDLNDALENAGVSVWFSEKVVLLGSNLMREIDKGLSESRAGLVLVTESFIKRIKAEGVADKELSALLARDLLVPIVHGVTYEDLREESPLLASRSGLDTADDTLEEIAAKISELVSTDAFSD
ncbi:toll/interleukin-1 receptor domain-containing protein [Mobiluncus curtisii]|uniref:toll/interleukin-1 receptor domain-containing protein n=1 Tax=Mobiluncus curtisii TaxID=2051 RepID=UPI0020163471|nr:toll/interleukin-1 receptor domain-containing protein [Mobiluncus curtisii]